MLPLSGAHYGESDISIQNKLYIIMYRRRILIAVGKISTQKDIKKKCFMTRAIHERNIILIDMTRLIYFSL